MKTSHMASIALAAALAAAPALAQTPSPNAGAASSSAGASGSTASTVGTAPATDMSNSAMGNGSVKPSNVNPVLADNGEIRASKLIGTDVYNDQNQDIGTINDILMSQNGQPDQVILSVGGGFLGMGGKLVSVPYNKLQLGQPYAPTGTATNAPAGNAASAPVGTTGNDATAANTTRADTTAANTSGSNPMAHRVLLPGATKEAVNSMPAFHFYDQNAGNTTTTGTAAPASPTPANNANKG